MCQDCKTQFDAAAEHEAQLAEMPVYQTIATAFDQVLTAAATALDFALTEFDREGDRGPDGEYTAEYVEKFRVRRTAFMKLVRYIHYQGVRSGFAFAHPALLETLVVEPERKIPNATDVALGEALVSMTPGTSSIEEVLAGLRQERMMAAGTSALFDALIAGDLDQVNAVAAMLGIEVELHTSDEPGDTTNSDFWRKPPTA